MRFKKAILMGALLALGLLSTPVWADELTDSRLKKIEDKQDEILVRLDEIRSELQIVKVRATN